MDSYLQCVTWTCTVWAGKRLPLPLPAVREARRGAAQCGGVRPGPGGAAAAATAAAAAAAVLSRSLSRSLRLQRQGGGRRCGRACRAGRAPAPCRCCGRARRSGSGGGGRRRAPGRGEWGGRRSGPAAANAASFYRQTMQAVAGSAAEAGWGETPGRADPGPQASKRVAAWCWLQSQVVRYPETSPKCTWETYPLRARCQNISSLISLCSGKLHPRSY